MLFLAEDRFDVFVFGVIGLPTVDGLLLFPFDTEVFSFFSSSSITLLLVKLSELLLELTSL